MIKPYLMEHDLWDKSFMFKDFVIRIDGILFMKTSSCTGGSQWLQFSPYPKGIPPLSHDLDTSYVDLCMMLAGICEKQDSGG